MSTSSALPISHLKTPTRNLEANVESSVSNVEEEWRPNIYEDKRSVSGANEIHDGLSSTGSRNLNSVQWHGTQTDIAIIQEEHNETTTKFEKCNAEKILCDREGLVTKTNEDEEEQSSPPSTPNHHARRPMNAFLIFCKKHRPIVRIKFPNLENRGVTRILGEWWALLDVHDKMPYTHLAKQNKDAFLSANPDFKWYKLPAPPLRSLNVRPSKDIATYALNEPMGTRNTLTTYSSSVCLTPNTVLDEYDSDFNLGKLADETQLGGLTSLMSNDVSSESNISLKPLKKRIHESYFHDMTLSNNYMVKFDDNNSGLSDNGHSMSATRQCKGKRYEQFMVENKLLGHKRLMNEVLKLSMTTTHSGSDTLTDGTCPSHHTGSESAGRHNNNPSQAESTTSIANTLGSHFDLDQKINELPTLSYDTFWQKKKQNKKQRKASRTKVKHCNSNNNSCNSNANLNAAVLESRRCANYNVHLVGSRKRKNKSSITHIEFSKSSRTESNIPSQDFNLLATLAEVAAKVEKIDENATSNICSLET